MALAEAFMKRCLRCHTTFVAVTIMPKRPSFQYVRTCKLNHTLLLLLVLLSVQLGSHCLTGAQGVLLVAQTVQPMRAPVSAERLQRWRSAVNTAWGEGTSTAEKLRILTAVWTAYNERFACFNGLQRINSVNLDSLFSAYRQEVERGVSRGRFAAILNYLSLALRESHTKADDVFVNTRTAATQGIPLMYVGGWGQNGHFGAALTPLPDSSLLVYRTVPQHPLGLVAGDVVVGYVVDGRRVAWKDLYPALLRAELPLTGWWWGSSPSSFVHSMLMSAGMNWHLFDHIVIAKYHSRDTVVLPTSLLSGRRFDLFATEQLPVAGVHFPFGVDDGNVSWGILNGTRIGYVYVWSWTGSVEDEFFQALDALKDNTDGLILDFRTNYGGNMFLSNRGLSLLFPHETPTIGFARRADPLNRFAMTTATPPSAYIIPSRGRGYTKPIAVLVGPGCISSGDQVGYRMTFHPRARIFGKPTAAAFNAPTTLNLGADWSVRFATAEAYKAHDSTQFLTRTEFPVDEPVWLTRDGVAAGRDDVVEAAKRWIYRTNGLTTNILPVTPTGSLELHIAPNPAQYGEATLSFTVPETIAPHESVIVTLHDAMGRTVHTLVRAERGWLTPRHQVSFSTTNLSAGLYRCRLQAGVFIASTTLVVVR
jgi:hypothetical protein